MMSNMEKTIEIPEGYEARIEGNKVILEPKESEDERIRKALIAVLKSDFDRDTIIYGTSVSDIIVWLEKQGKSVVYDRDNYNSAKEKAWNCKSLDDDSSKSIFMEGFQDGYQFGIHEEKPYRWTLHDEAVRKEAVACLLEWKNKFPFIDSIDYRNVMGWLKDELSIHAEEKQGSQNLANSAKTRKVEQNPAWSEEDENWMKYFENVLEFAYNNDARVLGKGCLAGKMWLKSLKERYTWKPSDEQIKGIECAIKTLQHQLNIGDKRLDSLYNDLKKLKE